jgi:hypothetical protein
MGSTSQMRSTSRCEGGGLKIRDTDEKNTEKEGDFLKLSEKDDKK